MRAYVLTHIGNVRTINEDSHYVPMPGEHIAAVADGMGGHLAGEVASTMAIRSFTEHMQGREINEETLHQAMLAANAEIFRAAQEDPDNKRGMGTTLTAVCILNGATYLAHVGDSRAYLLRNKALMQLSNDHSLVNEMMEKGELTPRQAVNHPYRNFVTRVLGTNIRVEPDIIRLDYQPGDVWLLCSDGLSNYLRSHELAEILMKNMSWTDKLDKLVASALSRGGTDNITAMVALGDAEPVFGGVNAAFRDKEVERK